MDKLSSIDPFRAKGGDIGKTRGERLSASELRASEAGPARVAQGERKFEATRYSNPIIATDVGTKL